MPCICGVLFLKLSVPPPLPPPHPQLFLQGWRDPGSLAGTPSAGHPAPAAGGRWSLGPPPGMGGVRNADGGASRGGDAPGLGGRCAAPRGRSGRGAGGDRGGTPGPGARGQPPQPPLRAATTGCGMSLTRKRGFYKQDINKTAWELPKTYLAPAHVGSGAYGAVW